MSLGFLCDYDALIRLSNAKSLGVVVGAEVANAAITYYAFSVVDVASVDALYALELQD